MGGEVKQRIRPILRGVMLISVPKTRKSGFLSRKITRQRGLRLLPWGRFGGASLVRDLVDRSDISATRRNAPLVVPAGSFFQEGVQLRIRRKHERRVLREDRTIYLHAL